MKILVVDDEALLVKGIRFNLQSEGYEVITGSDGLEAVTLVREEKPDLVIRIGRYQQSNRMFVEKSLFFILHQIGKHTAIPHMVSVYNAVTV